MKHRVSFNVKGEILSKRNARIESYVLLMKRVKFDALLSQK